MDNLWYMVHSKQTGERVLPQPQNWIHYSDNLYSKVMEVVTRHSSRIGCSKWWEFKNCDGDQYELKPDWVLPPNIFACVCIYILTASPYVPNSFLRDSILVTKEVSSKITCVQRGLLILVPKTCLVLSPWRSLLHFITGLSPCEVMKARFRSEIWNSYIIFKDVWTFLLSCPVTLRATSVPGSHA